MEPPGGDVGPGGTEPAFDGVAHGPDIRPRRTVKRDLAAGKYFQSQTAGERRSNPLTAVFRQYVDADLPHGAAVRRTASQTDQPAAVVSAYSQDVKMMAIRTKSIRPFRPVKRRKILLRQDARFIKTRERPKLRYIGQEIFRHKLYSRAVRGENIVESIERGRLKAVLNGILVQIFLDGDNELF